MAFPRFLIMPMVPAPKCAPASQPFPVSSAVRSVLFTMMSMPSHRPSNEIDTVFATAALPAHIASAAALIRRAIFIDMVLNGLEFAPGQSVDCGARCRKGCRFSGHGRIAYRRRFTRTVETLQSTADDRRARSVGYRISPAYDGRH